MTSRSSLEQSFDLPFYCERPLLAETSSWVSHRIAAIEGGRPETTDGAAGSTASDFRLLGDLEGVIDLDPQVPHR